MNQKVSLETARDLLLDSAVPVSLSKVPLLNAVGRVLSSDISAGKNVPHFRKSAMDGYAVIAEDTGKASVAHPVCLTVMEEIRAGFTARNSVSQGTSIKVMTGAPIPLGADSVVKWEDVVRQNNTITVSHVLRTNDNIVSIGEDVKQGDIVALKGAMVTPPLIAVFASLGLKRIPVYRKLKIAIFSTGDELSDLSDPLEIGKIYNSSLYGLYTRCKEIGTNPVNMGICPDVQEITAARIEQSLEQSDMVITTGGTAGGDYDVVKNSILLAGGHVLFQRVDIKPGALMIAAVKNGKYIIGLSGSPAAAMVAFDLIVIPLIKKLMGINEVLPLKSQGTMADRFTKSSPNRRILCARLLWRDGKNMFKLNGGQSNGTLMSMIGCNVMIDIPAGSGPIEAGQLVTGYLTGSFEQVDSAEY